MPFIFSLLSVLTSTAFALENKDFWYKVEAKKEPQKKETREVPKYTFDSIESKASERAVTTSFFWSRQPRFHLGAGFLYDKTWINDEHNKPWGIVAGWTFRDQGWSRILLDGWTTFRSHLILNGILQFMSSRKALRSFYGIGLSFDWRAQSQIRALVEVQNYWLIVNYGYEYILSQQRAVRLETRALLGTENQGLSLSIQYIWSL